jgi:hypothetical protein
LIKRKINWSVEALVRLISVETMSLIYSRHKKITAASFKPLQNAFEIETSFGFDCFRKSERGKRQKRKKLLKFNAALIKENEKTHKYHDTISWRRRRRNVWQK